MRPDEFEPFGWHKAKLTDAGVPPHQVPGQHSSLRPDAEVLVSTVRAAKLHSGRFRVRPGRPLPPELMAEDLDALRQGSPNRFRMLYPLEMPLDEKIETVATAVYGAEGVDFDRPARRRIEQFRRLGFGGLPACIAKTQYLLSHDPQLLGRPRGFRFPVRDVRLAAGAGFVYALAGEISTMPGLPGAPAARQIDLDADGRITGIR